MSTSPALTFEIVARCSRTKARVARLRLPHSVVDTPVFMPVGTQGTLKGILPEQASELGCEILLGNTYHLGHRPGHDVVQNAGGLHSFMNWPRSILTDSGGFQMVSLCKLMELNEQGVRFQSPHTGEEMMLTPEESISIQNALGADIIMQLDDVVHVLTEGERVVEAMRRSIRWLDRCIKAHKNPQTQNLFPIVQGGLNLELRTESCREIVKRDSPGIAIGGLSGGEAKTDFIKVVNHCTDQLPEGKPRYCMGVGFAVDLVVCCALGVDMFDCVYPTRTARFGNALTPDGDLNLKAKACETDLKPIQGGLNLELRTESCREIVKRDSPGIAIGGLSGGEAKTDFIKVVNHCTDQLPEGKPRYCMGVGFAVDLVVCCALGVDMFDCVYPTRTARFGNALTPDGDLNLKAKACETDLKPIQADCPCQTCKRHSRAYLHATHKEDTFAQLVSIHNVCYQLTLMNQVRQSIIDDKFPEFIKSFLDRLYSNPKKDPVPDWVKGALAIFNL